MSSISWLVVLGILAVIYITDHIHKKEMQAFYDRQIDESMIKGDIDTANQWIRTKSRYR